MPGLSRLCTTLSGVYYLFEDLVAFSGGVLSKGLKLLGKRVAGAGLFVCGDTGVEDSPLGVVAVRVRHGYSFGMRFAASIFNAFANLRMVRKCGSAWSFSILLRVVRPMLARSASSCCVRSARSRSLFT